jgi:hypothetical protein
MRWTTPGPTDRFSISVGADDHEGVVVRFAVDLPTGKDYAIPARVILVENHGAVMLVGRPCSR